MNSNPEPPPSNLHPQELRDTNDELSSELELLKSHRSDRKSRPSVDTTALSWTQDSDSGNKQLEGLSGLHGEFCSDT